MHSKGISLLPQPAKKKLKKQTRRLRCYRQRACLELFLIRCGGKVLSLDDKSTHQSDLHTGFLKTPIPSTQVSTTSPKYFCLFPRVISIFQEKSDSGPCMDDSENSQMSQMRQLASVHAGLMKVRLDGRCGPEDILGYYTIPKC